MCRLPFLSPLAPPGVSPYFISRTFSSCLTLYLESTHGVQDGVEVGIAVAGGAVGDLKGFSFQNFILHFILANMNPDLCSLQGGSCGHAISFVDR